MKRFFTMIIAACLFSAVLYGQNNINRKTLLVRCDDIGMSHAVNMAAKELIESGLLFSASVMFPCSWYQEGVEILKANPQIAVGVHLTLNAEWKNYRWGPVAGKSKVPSLVDENGYFFPTRASFFENNPKPDEVEIELRAQVERAIKSGLKITYLDYHMGTAVDKPELRKIVESLAKEYGLGISRYFKEADLKNLYFDPVDSKTDSLFARLKTLQDDIVYLIVCHIGKDTEELWAMKDMNAAGPSEMSKNRNAEFNALVTAGKLDAFKKNNIRLINYSDLIKEIGISKMKSPLESGY